MVAKKREELLNLIPAYTLGALDDDERIEFEAWLHNDQNAQSLLADYQAVADHLVALVPLRDAPHHLQADLRQRMAADSSRAGFAESAPASRAIRKSSARRFWWVLAAAAVLVIAIVGVVLTQMESDTPDSEPNAEQLYTQLAAQPDAGLYEIVPGEVDDAVSGNLLVSPDGTLAVLRIADLPAITSDQTFQMWLIDEAGTRSSGGLFHTDPAQEALYIAVPLARSITAYQGVGVSLEPAGGSPYADRPTGPRVLSVPLG